MKPIVTHLKSFWELLNRGTWGWGINVAMGIHAFRFSHSLIHDMLWYKEAFPKALLISLLAALLWSAWLHRPWAEGKVYA